MLTQLLKFACIVHRGTNNQFSDVGASFESQGLEILLFFDAVIISTTNHLKITGCKN